MATLREFFDTDFNRVNNNALRLLLRNSEAGPVVADVPLRVHMDFDANAKFISCYLVPEASQQSVINDVVDGIDQWLTDADGLHATLALPGEGPRAQSELRFAGRFYVYHEAAIADAVQEEIRTRANARGVLVQFRGPAFAIERSRFEKPLAFISHDSRDKDLIARPIAVGLAALNCSVWFDEFSLNVGDRLRESIERGLREARKCVLVITPNFINNGGWTREEFNAIFTRELVERTDVILPVWHDVTRDQVFEFSATLADRVAVNWNVGEKEAVRRLMRAIGD